MRKINDFVILREKELVREKDEGQPPKKTNLQQGKTRSRKNRETENNNNK